jgi:signal transduction histidine kinase/ActR/RegA family two-component response regulator
MAAEGSLSEFHSRWFLAALNEVGSVQKIFVIRNRQKLLLGVSILLGVLFFLATAVGLRMRQLRLTADRASNAKSMFVATMSHEIRTPMNGVLGMASLLRDTPLSSEQMEMLDTITQSSESLLGVINDVLDLSKLDARQLHIGNADYSPRDLLRSVAALNLPAARKKNIALLVDVQPDVPNLGRGDALRLRQILLNLTGNAIKFTETGTVTLSLEAPTPGSLRFTVVDTGIGIPENLLPNLFTPFTQADSGSTRSYEGTGLGLAISKKLVELMNGQIGVTSQPGHGSRFWFQIPFALPLFPVVDPAVAPPAIAPAGPVLRVLLVEDNPVNQLVATKMLQKLGHSVTPAGNGAYAIEAFRHAEWDLILMDCQMPDVDGYAATRQIRKLERTTNRRTRIVALTAHAMFEDHRKCLDAGMDDYITKPLELTQLRRVLTDASSAVSPQA